MVYNYFFQGRILKKLPTERPGGNGENFIKFPFGSGIPSFY